MNKIEKNYLEVDIFGEKYKLISDKKNEKQLLKVVDLINKKMEFLSKSFPQYSKVKVAILTSLNLADEIIKYSEDKEKYLETIKKLCDFVSQITENQESKSQD